MEEIRSWFIYILKLEQDSWYVGTAKGLRSRLRSHAKKSPYALISRKKYYRYKCNGLTGSRKATHLHAAFRSTGNCEWVTEIENCITVAMAKKYGFEKVRGGIHISPWKKELSDKTRIALISRFGNVDIRVKYNLEEIDLITEPEFIFPITKRKSE